MFLALLIGGEDRGQLRPGLAKAVAEGRPIRVAQEPAPVTPAEVAVAEEVSVAGETAPAPVTPVAEPRARVVAAALRAPEPSPQPAQLRRTAEPVFTLSALATPTALEPEVPAAEPQSQGDGQVWYVTANSVNVRQEPSTDAPVMGKLTRGESATVLWQEGDDWARVIVEGDGVEGYVATRFLAPNAP